jgi:hypothetical protein
VVERRIEIWNEKVKAHKPSFGEDKAKIVAKVEQMIGEVQAKMADEAAKYQARKAEMEAVISAADQAMQEEQPRHERVMKRLDNEMKDAKHRFMDLLRTKEQVDFHVGRRHIIGKLIAPDIEQRIAWINLGSKHRIVNGMRMLVAKRARENQFFFKGEIEVKSVRLDAAEVEIMKVFDPDVPLVHGDILVNPFIDKFRPMYIVFAGASKPTGHKFSIHEATLRLIEYNNEVHTVVDARTDFLMWTDYKEGESEYPPEYWKALELGIPIAKAKDLYMFLGD